MSFEYEWTRKDLKKELISKRYNTNIFFLILGILLYVWYLYDGIKSEAFDNFVILIGGVIYTAVLMLILFLLTRLYVYISLRKNDKRTSKAYGTYHVNLTDEDITVTINDEKVSYKYKDIIKLKKRKHYFFIRTNEDKIGLTFKEKVMGKENYAKIINFITEKVSC